MYTLVQNIFFSIFKIDNYRSRRIAKNILLSSLVKGGSIIVNLAIVSLCINYFSPVEYGIWIAMSTLINWVFFFDIGISGGLRNILTEAISKNDFRKARAYVSTSYFLLIICSIIIFIIFYTGLKFINIRILLGIPPTVKADINLSVLIILVGFCIQFVVQVINTVLISNHKPGRSDLNLLIGQLVVLIMILVADKLFSRNLVSLVCISTFVPILTLIISSLIYYRTELKKIRPSISLIQLNHAKRILSFGWAMFIIRIGSLILVQTDNIIISKLIGPGAVTEYNVAFRYYTMITIIFSLVMQPYWSAFTEAKTLNDDQWIFINMGKIRKFWVSLCLVGIPFLYLFSDTIIKLWIGDLIHIAKPISAFMCLYVIGYTCLNLNCYFLNGMNKIKLQLFLYLFVIVINVPLGVILGKFLGLSGIIISNIIMFLIMNVILWIQSNRILHKKATGIWAM